MRRMLFVVLVAGAMVGCGGASDAGARPTTPVASASLAPLSVTQSDVRLGGVDGTTATLRMTIGVMNPNAVDVTLRRLDGVLFFEGQPGARLEIVGDEIVENESEHGFEVEMELPAAAFAAFAGRPYVLRGSVRADGGTGDGALESPFELTGTIPQ